jgi:precorrin-8X/cobalt-precorrin-8 methylmutase
VRQAGQVGAGEKDLSMGAHLQNHPAIPPADIQRESFRIIEQEVGDHGLSTEAWLVARRVIHSTGDFEFAQLLQFHPQAFEVAAEAICSGEDILTDVEMVRMGIQSLAKRLHGLDVRCHLNDPDTAGAAKATGRTRSAQGLLRGFDTGGVGICVIGNAPTALRAAIDACQAAGSTKPRLIVGVPVGFVDAAESKEALCDTAAVPWITCVGRKGGSAVAAAIVNALLEWAKPLRPRQE